MFVPRCLKVAAAASGDFVKDGAGAPAKERKEQVAVEQEDEPIKAKCIEQRNAEPGEPRCAVCGRYGEYICNETNDDVCSLECKSVVLMYRELSFSGASKNSNERLIFRDGRPVLPPWEPDQAVAILSHEHVAAIRKAIDVSIEGESPPPPVLDFGHCKFPPRLLENLTSAGYDTPTPIQMQVLPAALSGRNILVSSHTGSGKTLGFLLPIISKCCRIRMGPYSEGLLPLAMVLTPTRELCMQIEDQAKVLGKGLPFKTALVVGGDVMPQQVYRIRKGVELIVATPGRLLDLLSKHDIDLSDVCMLALDEVDCILERGFREQAMKIIQSLSSPQIMLFSATIPPVIHSFSTSITESLLVISAGQPSIPTRAVRQTVLWVETNKKKKKLFDILQSPVHFQPPVVVFVNSRLGAELLADAIHQVTGLSCAWLHGQKPMKERRETMKSFLIGDLHVVVATGVLGRGLDFLKVKQVIIFDMPNTLQEYTHQIGRASRLDEAGSAFVFINNESKPLFWELIQLLRGSDVVLPQPVMKSFSKQVVVNPRKRKHLNTR